MALNQIHPSGREDFEAMLRHLGRTSDFEADDGPDDIQAPSGAIGPIANTVAVRSLITAKSRTYLTGGLNKTYNGWPEWVNKVKDDIVNGLFD